MGWGTGEGWVWGNLFLRLERSGLHLLGQTYPPKEVRLDGAWDNRDPEFFLTTDFPSIEARNEWLSLQADKAMFPLIHLSEKQADKIRRTGGLHLFQIVTDIFKKTYRIQHHMFSLTSKKLSHIFCIRYRQINKIAILIKTAFKDYSMIMLILQYAPSLAIFLLSSKHTSRGGNFFCGGKIFKNLPIYAIIYKKLGGNTTMTNLIPQLLEYFKENYGIKITNSSDLF